jgi:mono/diheme cytochrome c family protein
VLHGIDKALELAAWVIALVLVIMLFVGPQVVAEDESATSDAGAADAADGHLVFTGTCGSCHTLSAAGTSGTLGPKLDGISLDAAKIEGIVRDGKGRMPGFHGALTDGEVAAVAAFVASAEAGGAASGGAKGGAADGHLVFTGTCGSCHTLSAAGTSGTVGPNLDGVSLDAAAIEAIVRDGRGTMPAQGGKLSDDEIRAVAEFVAGN